MKVRPCTAWQTLLGILLSLVFLSAASNSDAGVCYTVRAGDTLSGIAQKYRVGVKAIQRINEIDALRLRPGSTIVIPVRDRTVRRRTEKSTATNQAVLGEKPAFAAFSNGSLKSVRQTASTIYYRVKKGDTLSSIARKYSVTIPEIRRLNGLRTSRLKRGQKLLIRQAGPRTYIVRRGDNLRKIARRFNLDPDYLMEINEMDSPALKAGQKLYLQETIDDSSAAEAYAGVVEKDTDEESYEVSGREESAGDTTRDRLVAFARKLLNIPYRLGGNSIFGIDCSAYVKKVYGLLGIELPRTAREQFNSGEPVDRDQLTVGDLVFFGTHPSFPSHVGIYIGNNLFIHASSKGRKVTVSNLDTPYFLRRFIGAKRLLTDGSTQSLSDRGVAGRPAGEAH